MSGFLVNKSLLDPTVTQYAGGTTSFTLPQSGSTNATEVFVGGVPQVAGVDFNISGTALTLTTSAPAGANMVCARQYFSDGITGTPATNSVATSAIQNDSVTGGKLNPALVAGDIIYADGTDTINRLAKGTALQTLQMNAGATAPNWVTAGGGHYTRISSTDISNAATYNFTAVDASSYDGYAFHIINLVPVTDDVKFNCRTSTDGGSSYDAGASDYKWCVNERDSAQFTTGGEAQISFMEHHADAGYSVGSAAGETGVCGWIYVHSPQTTAVFTMITATLGYVGDDGMGKGTSLVTGIRASAADVDAWQFYYSSGNIETGTITAYGINNS